MQVGVIGGGLAGVTAALACADAGHDVTLLESGPGLGGRARSFERGDLAIDTGQHVFLRCCTAYHGLLRRIGVAHRVQVQPRLDIPLRSPGGGPGRIRRSRLPAPLHLAAALAGHAALTPVERARLVPAALALRRLDPRATEVDTQSFGRWLGRHGQSSRAVEALWDVIGRATLNLRAGDASLAAAAMVFQEGLLTRADAGDIGWALAPLGHLHGDAAAGALAAAGVEIRTSTRVHALRATGDTWRIVAQTRRGRDDLVADRVVSAVPHGQAERLLPPDALDLQPGWSAALGTSPIVNVHVVYDRQVLDVPFVAALGTPLQWVFDRTEASGLHRTYPTDAQYLAVSLSAADTWVGRPVADLRETMLPALAALLPAARDARVLDFFVTREPEATFRAAPGAAALRPPTATRLPGLFLAGDWTATGWPATMESAVRSGRRAAEAVLGSAAPAAGGWAA